MAWLRKLWELAKRAKELWDWWTILSALGILPAAAVAVAVIQGAPLDVVILYIMAGVAYFVVIVAELPVVGEFIFARKRLSRQALKTLTALRVEIDGIVRALRRAQEQPPEPMSSSEQFQVFKANTDRLQRWIESVNPWLEKHRPQAIIFLSTCGEARSNLELAECYRQNFGRIYSEVTGETSTGPASHRETLGGFLVRGQDLAHRLAGGYGGERVTSLDLFEEIEVWARQVEAHFQTDRALGASYVARFRQDAMFPTGMVSVQNIPRWLQDWEAAVRGRCRKLETFITELGR